MKRKATKDVMFGGILLAVFILYTLSLTFVDVRPIGPNDSSVAFAAINGAIHELFGVHMPLFTITDRASLIALFIIVVFVIIGSCAMDKTKKYPEGRQQHFGARCLLYIYIRCLLVF